MSLCSDLLYLEHILEQYSNNLDLFLEILYTISTFQYFYQFAWVLRPNLPKSL